MLGPERRVAAIASILERRPESEKTFDREGKLVTIIVRPAPAADVLRAVDLLNRMDGTYERASTVKSASSDRTASMIAENLPLLHQPPRRTRKEGSA